MVHWDDVKANIKEFSSELARQRIGIIGLGIIVVMIIIGAMAPILAPKADQEWGRTNERWDENPERAPPVWVDYLTTKDYAHHTRKQDFKENKISSGAQANFTKTIDADVPPQDFYINVNGKAESIDRVEIVIKRPEVEAEIPIPMDGPIGQSISLNETLNREEYLFSLNRTEYEGYLEENTIAPELRQAIEEKYLFNLSDHEQYLEEGPINEKLRDAFGDEGYEVSENASLSQEGDNVWVIREDGKEIFTIRTDADELKIYEERYDVGQDAEISKQDEGWFIIQNGMREYRIEKGDDNLDIYRKQFEYEDGSLRDENGENPQLIRALNTNSSEINLANSSKLEPIGFNETGVVNLWEIQAENSNAIYELKDTERGLKLYDPPKVSEGGVTLKKEDFEVNDEGSLVTEYGDNRKLMEALYTNSSYVTMSKYSLINKTGDSEWKIEDYTSDRVFFLEESDEGELKLYRKNYGLGEISFEIPDPPTLNTTEGETTDFEISQTLMRSGAFRKKIRSEFGLGFLATYYEDISILDVPKGADMRNPVRVLLGKPNRDNLRDPDALKGEYKISINIEGERVDIDDDETTYITFSGAVFGLMGTDSSRRDLWQGWVWGARWGLVAGGIVAMVSVVLSTTYGMTSAYFGGWVDEVMSRLHEIMMGLPTLPILIMLLLWRRSIWMFILIYSLLMWRGAARVVRARGLQVAQDTYIEASKALGSGSSRIIRKHMIPQILPFAFAQAALLIPVVIMTEASLHILGLGDPGIVTWGTVLNDAHTRNVLLNPSRSWWWVLLPGIGMILVGFGFIAFGMAIERIINPKMQQR